MEDISNSRKYYGWFGLILIGVLIPLISSVIPSVIESFKNSSSLEYDYVGPIKVGSTHTFSIKLKNNGNIVENEIEIFLPVLIDSRELTIKSSIPYTLKTKDSKNIIYIDKLRPSEELELSFAHLRNGFSYISKYDMEDLRIVSEKNKAYLNHLDIETYSFYKFGFWFFVMGLVFLFLLAFYIEYFEPKQKKEKRILDEIEKLKD